MTNKIHSIKLATLFISTALIASSSLYAENADKMEELEKYCTDSGGFVEIMPAEINTGIGLVKGQSKTFCNFNVDKGFISMGLETFASDEPSIAATYIRMLPEISDDSNLWKGSYTNPAANVCKNLGGAAITFVAGGGFSDASGQSDICVFGDASMVSGWSLIYMANHRDGYDEIKNKVKAEPLRVRIPNTK